MIRLTRPTPVPKALHAPDGAGPKATSELCRAYERGSREFAFKSAIYAHASVKNALDRMQGGKCAFCETKLVRSSGDVEHFRPKGGWKQSAADELTQPGYYWLAYEWQNLFRSCQFCNQKFKKNLFPLSNPKNRARSHKADLAREQPLLIDPANEQPDKFISFRGETAFAVSGSTRGKTTIEVLGLNDERLLEDRREVLRRVQTIRRVLALLLASDRSPANAAEQTRYETELARVRGPEGEYSAMINACLE